MNPEHSHIRRLATGIPGLDAMLGGGLPELSFNLIAGPPGSGKTTLAHQLMFALASAERPALYFTFMGEPPLKMLRYQQAFEFFDMARINRSIYPISLAEDAMTGDLERVLARITDEIRAHTPALVFLDSFRSLSSHPPQPALPSLGLPLFIQQLGILMSCWQSTTFLIGEYPLGEPNPVLTVADGLIWLDQHVHGNTILRSLKILKMRGQAPLAGRCAFRIGPAGIQVFTPPGAARPPRALPNPGVRVPMGVAGLDGMMGGGLPRGYTLLVAGPSGSGKSILALAFLAEGARLGEVGVIASFGPRLGIAPSAMLGQFMESGQVRVLDTGAPDLSVDELALLLLEEVRAHGARRIVIDSLPGLALALAPTCQEAFHQSLARLLASLGSCGVTVLITCEQDAPPDHPGFYPHPAAFLADAIIALRYIEEDRRLMRALAVVKLRASPHTNEWRLFRVDELGLHLTPFSAHQVPRHPI
jgi:circadian clock protein KaiC